MILVAILCAGPRLAYDEVFHLTTVKALFRLGFTREFLLGTPWSGPGPLYALIQGAFAPLTGSHPPGIRLVNFACVLGMVELLRRTLLLREVAAPLNVTLGLVAAPMLWVVFALAMTDEPAMLFAAASLLLTLLWQREDTRPLRRDALAVSAGLLLGVAVTGRQVYAVVVPVVVLLARRGALRPLLLHLISASLLPAALFSVWGGLSSPEMSFVGHGVRPSNALLSYADIGAVTLLLAPRYFSLRLSWGLCVSGGLLLLNLLCGLYGHVPYLLAARLPPALLPVADRSYGSLVIILAALFVASTLKNVWERRGDREFMFATAAMMALALTPLKIVHMWDMRYIAVALPFLLVTLDGWVTLNFARAARLTLGIVIGAAWLQFTYVHWDYSKYNENNLPTMRQFLLEPGRHSSPE